MLFTKILSKLVHACQNYSLLKLVRFLRHGVVSELCGHYMTKFDFLSIHRRQTFISQHSLLPYDIGREMPVVTCSI